MGPGLSVGMHHRPWARWSGRGMTGYSIGSVTMPWDGWLADRGQAPADSFWKFMAPAFRRPGSLAV